MPIEQFIGLIAALLVMLVGSVGSFLPAIPSTPLVLAGAVGHRLVFGEAGPGNLTLGLLILLSLLALLMDYFATVYGARKLGATWRGLVGAILGLLVGVWFSLPGLLLGPFVGAAVAEMTGGRNWKDSSLAGMGAVLGLLAGSLGKLACCVAMTGLFVTNVLWRAWHAKDVGAQGMLAGCGWG